MFITIHITHAHIYTTHTHTHRMFAMTKCKVSHLTPWLVCPIHTTHQLLHVLDLYILDCLLKVALPRPQRSRNLLQMTPSAQILGGCVVADPSYLRFIKTGQLWARAHNCPVLMSLKYAWIHHWVCLTSS